MQNFGHFALHNRLGLRREIPQGDPPAVHVDSGAPCSSWPVEAHAMNPGRVMVRYFSVLAINHAVREAQVPQPIVVADAVNVVDLLGPFAMNHQPDEPVNRVALFLVHNPAISLRANTAHQRALHDVPGTFYAPIQITSFLVIAEQP